MGSVQGHTQHTLQLYRRSQCSGDQEGPQIREENKLIGLPPDCLAEVIPLLITSRISTWMKRSLPSLFSRRQELFIVSDLRIQNSKPNWFPGKWDEVLSNTPSTHPQVMSSKDISCRANSHGVICPNNCIFPLDSSGSTHSRKKRPTFVARKKGAQIMNPWTEIRLMHEAQNLLSFSLTTAATSKPYQVRKGEMMEVKCSMLIYLRASQFYVQVEETVFLEPFPHGWKISRRWKRCQFKLCCDLINTCFHSSDSTTLVTWKSWLSSAELKWKTWGK